VVVKKSELSDGVAILEKSIEKGYGKTVAFDNPRKKQREEVCV
jgi:hypothetical protein